MTIKGVQAWVTSAVDEKAVTKALLLAASLRRVRTSKKLAVLTTSAVSKDIREKLEEVFDLVVLLEQATLNGVNLEEYAKIQAFSLLVFSKCVYLAPQTLVLKNCDEIFDKFGHFAISEGDHDDTDTSVYMFTPAVRLRRALEKIAHRIDSTGKKGGKEFSKYFKLWMQNHVPNSDQLGKEYNVRVALNTATEECLDVVIANFFETYPLDCGNQKLPLGVIGKHVVGEFWKVYQEQSSKKEILDLELTSDLPKASYETEPIAIVGLDFRLPGANTPSEFWDLLANGREGIITLPPFRWQKDQICIPCKNRNAEAGFLNFPIDDFDAKFFGISPKDALFLDPQQRLLHEVTWCSLEDAGLDPSTLHGTKTGIFVGSWIHDYKDQVVRSPDVDFFRSYIGNSIAATAARLSHFLGTTGPSIATESGCSSGIVAVDMAFKSLRSYDSDMAIACGVNLLLHPFDPKSVGFVFSPSARCKTFDVNADGFGRAEGCAVLVMKRLSDAVRDGNKIWGLIRGSAVTQEGVSRSIGTPTIHSESLAMELALSDAGVEPKDVTFVETHGTGTQVGDPLEVAAISKAYSKGRTNPLIIGSVKTNVGHTESVSGITGIIKVLLSMKHEMIPPHLNFETLNPNVNLDEIPAKLPLNAIPWPRESGKPRLAGVSSFGISGGDGHVIIEETPVLPKSQIDFNLERPLHIMKVSAKTEEALQKIFETYEHMFREKAEEKHEEHGFADIAHSVNTGRATFSHRATIVASDFKQAAEIIKANSFNRGEVQVQSSPICFLFTGQGSQYPNMALALHQSSPVFRTHFDKCAEVLQTRYNIPIKQVLWGNATDGEKLSRTLYSQTSIFCVEYCLLKLWESWGVKPDFVMGHSLGEFAAAVAAGALGFEDALMLVAERSRLIDSLPRGKMLVLRADKKTVDYHIAKYKENHPAFWADYAALNSPDQTVIAGDSQMIEDFAKVCGDKSLKVIVLAATHAFHSRHMDPMLEKYRRIAGSILIKPVSENLPKYISGMEGRVIEGQDINADYWVRHTREKVSFMDACKAVHSEGCTLFLEVGPHPVLSALAMMNIEGASIKCLPSLRRTEKEWVTILDSLSKLYLSGWKGKINWNGFDQFYPRNKVDLPFYPFNRRPAWVKTRHAIQELHPLLGKVFLNASSQTIFEREMTVKNTSFVPDHVIGSTVVFPGAGFLELALAGGYASVQGLTEDWSTPRRAIGISNLKIAAPLALSDTDATILQTVVTLDNKEDTQLGYSVAIHRNNDPDNSCGGQWVLHASATFEPVAKINSDLLHPVNIEDIQNTWEKSDRVDFYEKLPQVGLRFGPKFQSLVAGWRSETESAVLTQVKVPDDYTDSYLIHPVVGDAMLQAMMFWVSRDTGLKKKLQVPVHIGQFIWLASSTRPGRYIYCSTNDTNGKSYCLLLDDEGTPLSYMTDIDFVETNVKLIEGLIQQQTSAMPFVWEEIWKPTRGPLQSRFFHELEYPTHLPEETEEELRELNNIGGETELKFIKNVRPITHCFFLEALLKLGWKPQLNVPFTLDELIKTLSIKREHKMYVRFFLRSLALVERDAILEMLSEDSTRFRLKLSLPKIPELVATRKRLASEMDTTRIDYRLLADVGEGLDKMLTGEVDPLAILFREDPSKANMRDCYDFLASQIKDSTLLTLDCFVAASAAKAIEKDVEAHLEKPVVRILEVGAGTGVLTTNYIKSLQARKMLIEYYYTDISIAFFKAGEEKLGELAKDVIFKKFNMEEDPFEQGFSPGYFDLILACEVLHISKDAGGTLKKLRSLLRPGGVIQIMETVQDDPRLTMVWGLLDGYWRFEDYHIRPFHVSIQADKWIELLHSAKFPRALWRPAYHSLHGTLIGIASNQNETTLLELSEPKHVWLVFDEGTELTQELRRKLVGINRKVVVFSKPSEYIEESLKEQLKSVFQQISESGLQFEGVLYLWGLTETNCERDQRHISLPLLTLYQLELEFEKFFPRIYALTQGVYSVGDSEVLNPACGTIRGLVSAMSNENLQYLTIHLDLCPTTPPLGQVEEIFQNCFHESNFTSAFREGKRMAPRFTSLRPSNDYLSLPSGCDRFHVQLPETKLISDLEFVFLEPYTLGEYDIEVQTKAYSLNFRDLFAVLKPAISVDHIFGSAGLDYSGVVTQIGSKVTKWKVGDKIIAMDVEDKYSLASHLKMNERLAMPLPTNMTFGDGSTLPTVFLTVFHSLTQLAKLKRGETMLIHTASGGVGLCAIQIAREMGANIIATAGSPRKRNYLRNLGIKHVFHSRTTEFSKQILEVTGGRGVDVVLNSLTGPGFKEASLDCLTKSGRFVEMSKLNVWQPEEVQKLRSDALYWIVNLEALDEGAWHDLRDELRTLLKTGSIKAIPYLRFDALNIRGALNYLQKAKHIGKIVCIMPEVKVEKTKLVGTTPLFNEDSTYVVTGGLGGIGFAVVKWMLSHGAKHIATMGRSPPKPSTASEIEQWNKRGKHIQAYSADVGNYEQCRQVFEEIQHPASGFPHIRGVMHAAGVLRDATILNQSWDSFYETFKPKIDGSWNLHDLTKDLMLEHFVLFSSVSSTFGSPGQANHSTSNSFEDTLAFYRNSIGLPATTVNWGNWGEVGVATEIDFPGLRPISTAQGLLALESFLTTQRTHTIVANIESFSRMATLFPKIKYYVDDKRLFGDGNDHSIVLNSDELWAAVDGAESIEAKLEVFKTFIKMTLRSLLKMDPNEEIDDHVEFQSIGIDSLMMLEMKNVLQNVLGARMTLSVNQLKDCTSTQLLANKLVDILQGEEDKRNLPTPDELKALIREDSKLPENIVPPAGSLAVSVDKVRVVLLTGVTGNMGPYFLRNLSRRANIEKIYCLIRKSGKDSPSMRLHAKLRKCQLLEEVDMKKVECILGDMTDPLFGLSEETYEELAGSVDAIVHSAVRSDHNAKYWKVSESRKSHVRTANVFGTIKILEFAVHKKVKHVYHAATLLSATSTDENDRLLEDWQDVGALDDVRMNIGYPISKHIGEQLIQQAIERGIPCKAFRLPFVSGDSRTGYAEYESNHLLLRCLGVMKLGCMPDIPAPLPAIPVDKCVEISLRAFFDKRAISDVYHVTPKNPDVEQIIVPIAKEFGVDIDTITYEEFIQKLKTLDENSPLAPFADLYQDEDTISDVVSPTAQCARKYFENSEDFFTNKKLSELYPGFEESLEQFTTILRRDLGYLEKTGVFKKFGITTTSENQHEN